MPRKPDGWKLWGKICLGINGGRGGDGIGEDLGVGGNDENREG